MTSAENRVSESSNLNIFWRSITPNPPTRFLPSALEIMPPPVTKTPSYGPATLLSLHFCGLLVCPHLSGDWS